MELVGMMTVRDEDDILPETLEAWADAVDRLIVVDCGSVDQSVEIIEEVAARRKNIDFVAKLGPIYSKKIRSHLWAKFSPEYSSNDWWLIADADEFIEEDFRPLLERATAEGADHVFSEHINHYIKVSEYDKAVEEIKQHGRLEKPVRERLLHYRKHISMIRCIRICPWIRWEPDSHFPRNLSVPATERIAYYHYQYRDPGQIEKRVRARSSFDSPEHAAQFLDNPHWLKKNAVDAISPDDDPQLRLWTPEEGYIDAQELPPPPRQGKIKSLLKKSRAMAYGFTHPQKGDSLEELVAKYPPESN